MYKNIKLNIFNNNKYFKTSLYQYNNINGNNASIAVNPTEQQTDVRGVRRF